MGSPNDLAQRNPFKTIEMNIQQDQRPISPFEEKIFHHKESLGKGERYVAKENEDYDTKEMMECSPINRQGIFTANLFK